MAVAITSLWLMFAFPFAYYKSAEFELSVSQCQPSFDKVYNNAALYVHRVQYLLSLFLLGPIGIKVLFKRSDGRPDVFDKFPPGKALL